MKVVALALVLLAVGSHAASLQADAPAEPSQLAHLQTIINVALPNWFEKLRAAVNTMEDVDAKNAGIKYLNDLEAQLKTHGETALSSIEGLYATVGVAFAEYFTALQTELDATRATLDPQVINVVEILKNHIKEYKTVLEPIRAEYYTKHLEDMEALKLKLQPILEELKKKIETNSVETKAALMPVLETVRTKTVEWTEILRAAVAPYMDDYKEQVKAYYTSAQNVNTEELKEKVSPLVEDIKVKGAEILQHISNAMTS